MMYVLNLEDTIKTIVKDLTESMFKNSYKKIGFTKNDGYNKMKIKKKVHYIFIF